MGRPLQAPPPSVPIDALADRSRLAYRRLAEHRLARYPETHSRQEADIWDTVRIAEAIAAAEPDPAQRLALRVEARERALIALEELTGKAARAGRGARG